MESAVDDTLDSLSITDCYTVNLGPFSYRLMRQFHERSLVDLADLVLAPIVSWSGRPQGFL